MNMAGYLLIEDNDGISEHDLLRCVHCQYQWRVEKGSGKTRGWCLRCSGPTCGAGACYPCVPFERKLEALERR